MQVVVMLRQTLRKLEEGSRDPVANREPRRIRRQSKHIDLRLWIEMRVQVWHGSAFADGIECVTKARGFGAVVRRRVERQAEQCLCSFLLFRIVGFGPKHDACISNLHALPMMRVALKQM